MALDSYVNLGHSGLRVSPFCLGTMAFGEDLAWGASTDEAAAMLAEYVDRGGNFIDAANLYTNDQSEKIVGDFFARSNVRRDQAVIGTKFFCSLYNGYPNGGAAGRKAMMQQAEASLRRLQTDYIDIYWVRGWDQFTPVEETLRGLENLVSAGKVRYIALSDLPAWKISQAQTIAAFRGWSPVIALQLEYSLLERTVEAELIPMAREMGIGVMPRSPLRNGFLSGKFRCDNGGSVVSPRTSVTGPPSESDFSVIDVLVRVADEIGGSPAAVALAWVRGRSGVASTIIDARRKDQFVENLGALDVMLSPSQIASLDAASVPPVTSPAKYAEAARMLAFPSAPIDGVTTPPSASLDAIEARYCGDPAHRSAGAAAAMELGDCPPPNI